MPNGKIHDNPISDIFIHGLHPFPMDIEELVRELDKLEPHIFNELEWAPFDWERGKYLDEARSLLRALIESHGDRHRRREHIKEYRARTK